MSVWVQKSVSSARGNSAKVPPPFEPSCGAWPDKFPAAAQPGDARLGGRLR
ncbi:MULTISPECIES: hypothetical protein [unclassified Brevibacterium]|uniref:hypothetical protein n=1 Tax=unclassified Brevibacterium TaxID=2614124 RepID=UPI001E43FADF|nr:MULTISPECIES: hypothetical protein [unclassified Brevibacterium]MDK8433765.1 hypothetical protein [Brevibacterium sp. H-BE7]